VPPRGFFVRQSSGIGRREFQELAWMDPVVLHLVHLPDSFDSQPGVVRRWVVLDSYRPQGVTRSNSIGDRGLFGVGPGASVKGAGDYGHQKHGSYPPPAVNIRWFHPRKIKDETAFPNTYFRKVILPSTRQKRARSSTLTSRIQRQRKQGSGKGREERNSITLALGSTPIT
jgi:hypothetical protein